MLQSVGWLLCLLHLLIVAQQSSKNDSQKLVKFAYSEQLDSDHEALSKNHEKQLNSSFNKSNLDLNLSNCNSLCETGHCVNGLCQKCKKFSNSIEEISVENAGIICKCRDGDYLQENGSCVPCGNLCTRCENNGKTCVYCENEGLEIDQENPSDCKNSIDVLDKQLRPCRTGMFLKDSKICAFCGGSPGCLSCDSDNSCDLCESSKSLYLGQCITLTHSKYYRLECNSGCKTCNSGTCEECTIQSHYLTMTNDCDECPNGKFSNNDGKTCSNCGSLCKTCIDSTECTVCTNRLHYISNKICVGVCPDAFYSKLNGKTCGGCHPDCEKCIGSSRFSCTYCVDLFVPLDPPSRACECEIGLIRAAINPGGPLCGSCDSGCATCLDLFTDASTCITCWDPTIIPDGADVCNYICDDIYCLSCTNSISICDLCIDIKFVDTDETCQDCSPGTKPNGLICVDCTDDINCLKCPVDLNICEKCVSTHAVIDGLCSDSCPDFYYVALDGVNCNECTFNDCKLCDEYECLECDDKFGLEYGDCVTCDSADRYVGGFECVHCNEENINWEECTAGGVTKCSDHLNYVDNGVCTVCPNNKYSKNNGKTCGSCFDINCGTCTDDISTSCTKCSVGYKLITEGCELCPTGKSDGLVCCHKSCSTCNGPSRSECLTCLDTNININTDFTCSCPSGSYIKGYAPLACESCPESCDECLSAVLCTDCAAGTTLATSSPFLCLKTAPCLDAKCQLCYLSEICVLCKLPYYLDVITCQTCLTGQFSKITECGSCSTGCSTCTDENICTQCDIRSIREGNRCVDCDKTGFSLANDVDCCAYGTRPNADRSQCVACTIPNCEICRVNQFSVEICDSCFNPYETIDNLSCTMCPDGKYTLHTPYCANCNSSECKRCSDGSATSCTECKLISKSINLGACQDCPDGEYPKNDYKTCGMCHGDCETCDGGTKNNCLTCVNLDRDPSLSKACTCEINEYEENQRILLCKPCHGDCKTCLGPNYDDCTSCIDSDIKPDVILGGRCTCDYKCSQCTSGPDICESCNSPYVKYNDLCVCPYNTGGPFCSLTDVEIKVADSFIKNTFHLKFEENLARALDSSELTFSVVSDLRIVVTHDITIVSLAEYQFPVTFTPEYFGAKADLKITLNGTVYTAGGTLINKTKFTYALEGYEFDPDSVAKVVLQKTLPKSSQPGVGTGAIFSASASSFILQDSSYL